MSEDDLVKPTEGDTYLVNFVPEAAINVAVDGTKRRAREARQALNLSSNKVSPALIEAATRDHVGVTEVLLDAGADIESSWGDHRTALMAACSGGRLSIAQTMVAHGAKVSYTAADGTSFSAFDQTKRHPDIVKWLESYCRPPSLFRLSRGL